MVTLHAPAKNDVPFLIPSNHRPARGLIGWLPREHAVAAMARLGTDPDLALRVDRAHASVAARAGGLVQDPALTEVGPEVDTLVRARLAHPAMAPFVTEGWQPRLVDLRQVVSLQSLVNTDGWNAEIALSGDATMVDIVEVTIPPPDRIPPVRCTQVGNSFCVQSPNPNLRVASPVHDPDSGVFGFAVHCALSVLQVVKVGNRLLLRDGYNRAYALLRRGIHVVPCLYREWPVQQDLGVPSGMLAPSVYLGDRPPMLPDFLDDEVAADVSVPAARKMILIHAVETMVE